MANRGKKSRDFIREYESGQSEGYNRKRDQAREERRKQKRRRWNDE